MKGAAVVFDTIEKLGLQDAVIVTGHVPEKFIPGLYAGARVLVMPSLYEGFGFPVLESMAVGTPVVASGTSSLPEVAGDAALFCPPNDHESFAQAIEAVLGNPALVKELRQKGIERSRQFTWQRTAQETLEIYQAVARS
jgi:glycosyltransferase involved in cell wall biosynthesis